MTTPPPTQSGKFINANESNDTSRVSKSLLHKLEETEQRSLRSYCKNCRYYQKWRLQPCTSKTVSHVSHLHNTKAVRKLPIKLSGQCIDHEKTPTYSAPYVYNCIYHHLEVHHLKKTEAKISTRNNQLKRLAGSTWGNQGPDIKNIIPCSLLVSSSFAPVQYCLNHIHLAEAFSTVQL